MCILYYPLSQGCGWATTLWWSPYVPWSSCRKNNGLLLHIWSSSLQEWGTPHLPRCPHLVLPTRTEEQQQRSRYCTSPLSPEHVHVGRNYTYIFLFLGFGLVVGTGLRWEYCWGRAGDIYYFPINCIPYSYHTPSHGRMHTYVCMYIATGLAVSKLTWWREWKPSQLKVIVSPSMIVMSS